MCDDDLDSAMIVEVNGGPAESCGGFGTLNYMPVPKSIEERQVDLSLSLLCWLTIAMIFLKLRRRVGVRYTENEM